MERKLTAILCADVHGYSRLMGEDEEATIRNLSAHRRTIERLIEQHHGRFVNSAGDSVLAEFASAVNAVECAVEIQTALKAENAEVSPARRMEFRIGVNLGDVVVENGEIYGDGVNVAARLESLADPGSIYISASIHEQIGNKLALGYEDLGEQHVKNIAKPIRVFRVLPTGTPPTLRERRRISPSYWRGGVLSLTGLAIIIGTILIVQHLSFKPPRTSASIPPQQKPALTPPSIPSIAVLPFANLSGDPRQEYFSDGLSGELINELSRVPGLFVIARNSSFAFKGKTIKERDVGRELGVKYMLEGTVDRTAKQLRVGVELVDASSATEMWTVRYDRPVKDIFALQDEIVGRVVTTLGLIFKLQEMQVPWGNARPTANLEAFDDYLRGLEYNFRFTKDDNPKARLWFEKALALDPRFVDAYIQLGATYFFDAAFRWSKNPEADVEHLYQSEQKALALDDSNCGALALMTRYDVIHRRFDQALADGERAVATNPNCSAGYGFLSDTLIFVGKPREALAAAEKAIRLDPSSRDFWAYVIGRALCWLGHPQEAIPIIQRNLAAFPNAPWGHLDLVFAYVEAGRLIDARAEAAKFMRGSPQLVLPPLENAYMQDGASNRRVYDDLHKAGLK
jgi:adenylate cyclase